MGTPRSDARLATTGALSLYVDGKSTFARSERFRSGREAAVARGRAEAAPRLCPACVRYGLVKEVLERRALRHIGDSRCREELPQGFGSCIRVRAARRLDAQAF